MADLNTPQLLHPLIFFLLLLNILNIFSLGIFILFNDQYVLPSGPKVLPATFLLRPWKLRASPTLQPSCTLFFLAGSRNSLSRIFPELFESCLLRYFGIHKTDTCILISCGLNSVGCTREVSAFLQLSSGTEFKASLLFPYLSSLRGNRQNRLVTCFLLLITAITNQDLQPGILLEFATPIYVQAPYSIMLAKAWLTHQTFLP